MKFLKNLFKKKQKQNFFEKETPEQKQDRELQTKQFLYLLALQLDKQRKKKNENY